MADPALFNPQTVTLWAQAAQGLILQWKRTGPTPASAQWCSDAVRVMEMAGEILEAAADMEARKDAAYEERNKVVAALAKVFPSGIARTAIEGWSEDWHGCVYIDLPTGQASWHFHDSQAHLFAGLPPYTKSWDGHDTPEKYRRVAALGLLPSAGEASGEHGTGEKRHG